MHPLKQKQYETLKTLGCKDLADKVNEIIDFLNKPVVFVSGKELQLEDHNFRIDSTGWKKGTEEGQDYLMNPKGDVWELINCKDSKLNGEQLFTFKAMMRETKKAGKRVPTDEEFSILLKEKEDMPNLVFAGLRLTDDSFCYLGTNAYFWSSSVSGSDVWSRHLNYCYSTVYQDVYDQAYGFSVRCLK